MQDLASVTAVIPAGGLGTRLRPVVSDRPKVLAEVQGRPFLAYLLDQLAVAGLRDVVLCTGYGAEQVLAAFGEAYRGLHLHDSQETLPLGTAGALRLALPLVRSDTVLVMNGDSFCQVDLPALWAWHVAQGAAGTIVLTEVADTAPYGRVYTDTGGVVRRFEEKAAASGAGWVNAGVYVLKFRLLVTIPVGRAVSLEHEIFPTWIGRGLYGYRGRGRFLDIGTPETYARAGAFFPREKSR